VLLQLGELELRGRVVDADDGSPVPGLSVFALAGLERGESVGSGSMEQDGERWEFGSVSDAEGRFALSHLAAGRYLVGVDGSASRGGAMVEQQLAPGEVPEIEFRVPRTGSVSGSARTAAGTTRTARCSRRRA